MKMEDEIMISKMKLERVRREVTQVDLWMKTGIPQWRLSLIERGITPRPTEAEKIGEALGVNPEELFSLESPDPRVAMVGAAA
ncbi:MAG: XRE family transcriptional regulator [Desulfobacteraceae bacterium]|nr:MAG: XRE family transcriptional regulator [Desulfobacteraceae bacterium]